MKYLTVEDCDVDIIRSIYNMSNKFSILILVGGHGQAGKTTLIWYICNRLAQLRKYGYRALDPNAKCNTYKEWDGFKYSATNPKEFVSLWNNNENAILTLSEASTTLYYMDWMNVMARVFNSTTTTQGLKHNICFLDTVMESELMQKARDKIDYRIELHKRNDWNRSCEVRSGWSLIDYLGMKWILIRNNTWNVYYTRKMLTLSKKYTDWIAGTLKKREAEENERRVGLRPSKDEYDIMDYEEKNTYKDVFVQKQPRW